MTEQTEDRFRLLLRASIQERGLSLESIQRRLSERGLSVGRSTLSYWQNGRRRPSGPTSAKVVTALEDILRVPGGTLLDSLATSGRTDVAPVHSMTSVGAQIDRLIAQTGCSDTLTSLEQTSFVDLLTVSSIGTLVETRSVVTVRAMTEVERYPAIVGGEEGGSAALIRHEAVSGCRVGRVARDEELNLCVSELVLDRRLRRGDTHLLQVVVHDDNAIEATSFYRLLVTPPALLAMELSFHPDRLPVRVEEFEKATDDGPDTVVRARTLGVGWRVNLVRERARRGVVGLRWTYA